jgi:hypothetical protein
VTDFADGPGWSADAIADVWPGTFAVAQHAKTRRLASLSLAKMKPARVVSISVRAGG